SLRAIQHALKAADSTLSDDHKRVIEEWWRATPPLSTPELHFIQTSRNLILKAGGFPGFAIYTESSTGEEPNIEITGTSYELAYYDKAGKRQDLEEAIRSAIGWCDRELTAIEAKLPLAGKEAQCSSAASISLAWSAARSCCKLISNGSTNTCARSSASI